MGDMYSEETRYQFFKQVFDDAYWGRKDVRSGWHGRYWKIPVPNFFDSPCFITRKAVLVSRSIFCKLYTMQDKIKKQLVCQLTHVTRKEARGWNNHVIGSSITCGKHIGTPPRIAVGGWKMAFSERNKIGLLSLSVQCVTCPPNTLTWTFPPCFERVHSSTNIMRPHHPSYKDSIARSKESRNVFHHYYIILCCLSEQCDLRCLSHPCPYWFPPAIHDWLRCRPHTRHIISPDSI